jgi:hypothetical protein
MEAVAIQDSRDVQCYGSHFDVLCKAKDIGIESHVQCLEENPQYCQFSVPFGYAHFCQSPLRIHICKKLGK